MDRHDNAAPVIIRRKRRAVGGDAHHGGAWKVAYADFVTAMMAFFLLMWLLNATTDTQRSGLADYFSPTIPISRSSGGGDGALMGEALVAEDSLIYAAVEPETGTVPHRALPSTAYDLSAERVLSDAELAAAEHQFLALSGEALDGDEALRHVITRVTDEGLVVELFDLPGQPLFQADTAQALPVSEALAEILAEVFAPFGNGIVVEGHLQSYPVVLLENPAWDLSTARAQSVRNLLERAGLEDHRMQRVTGHADRRPVDGNLAGPRNNRLEVILLRSPLQG